jgi:hypothetical protein
MTVGSARRRRTAVLDRIPATLALREFDLPGRALGRLGVAEAGVAGAQDGLGAVGNLELGEDG